MFYKKGEVAQERTVYPNKTTIDFLRDGLDELKFGQLAVVLDLLKLPSEPDNFFVTQDEHLLFYDDAGKVIRIIYPNPSPKTLPTNSTSDPSNVAT